MDSLFSRFTYNQPCGELAASEKRLVGRWVGELRSLAERSYWPAQVELAEKLIQGHYVERDLQEAESLLVRAAEGGHGIACHNLAVCYLQEIFSPEGCDMFRLAYDYARRAVDDRVDQARDLVKLLEAHWPHVTRPEDEHVFTVDFKADAAHAELAALRRIA